MAPALVAVFVVNAALIFVCVFCLRRAARNVRKPAINFLQRLRAAYVKQPHKWGLLLPERTNVDAISYDKNIQLTLDTIENIRTGAFAVWPADLAMIAALVPTGGAGLLALLQRLLF